MSNNPHIPTKLNSLEAAGLLTQVADKNRRSIIIDLTDKGRQVAAHLTEVNKLLTA